MSKRCNVAPAVIRYRPELEPILEVIDRLYQRGYHRTHADDSWDEFKPGESLIWLESGGWNGPVELVEAFELGLQMGMLRTQEKPSANYAESLSQ